MSNQPPERIYIGVNLYKGHPSMQESWREKRWLKDDIEYRLASTAAKERDEAISLLRRVVEIVSPEAFFEPGEDPHPPAVLDWDITQFLARNSKGDK